MDKVSADNAKAQVLRFGSFELDTETRTLYQRGRRVRLQDMPLKVLLILLERPGELISYQEFYRRLWPDDEVGLLEDNLYTAMGKLRRALRDPARKPNYIETVPRRGYCLVAPVVPVSADNAATTVAAGKRWHHSVLVVVLLLALGGSWYWLQPAGVEEIQARQQYTLAVLPFQNLGRHDDRYFADGISDEITARLVLIEDLSVIGRASVTQFRDSAMSIEEIGRELSADYVLHGSVRWDHRDEASSRVRVTSHLMRTHDGTNLWAMTDEQPLAEVFRVQADIAEQVAEAMDLTLFERERVAIKVEPTTALDAYDYYLRGNEYLWRSEEPNDFELAIGMYRQAVALDPDFAQAWARLSTAHARQYWFHWDRSTERLGQASQAIERALAMDPDLPEVRLALGTYYYWGQMDYERALSEYDAVHDQLSGSAEFQLMIGSVYRRQGRWEDAARHYREAARLDPRSAFMSIHAGQVLYHKRHFEDSMQYLERARSVAPDIVEPYFLAGLIHLARDADTKAARKVVEAGVEMAGGSGVLGSWLEWTLMVLDLYDGESANMLNRAETVDWEWVEHQYQFQPLALLRGYAHVGLEQPEQARQHFELARLLVEQQLQENPDDPRLHSAIGLALAGLGQPDEAIAAGRKGLEMMHPDTEAMRGPYRAEELARIYVMAGKPEQAFPLLKLVLERPSHFSVAHLQHDPAWQPLRNHDEYQRLVSDYAH